MKEEGTWHQFVLNACEYMHIKILNKMKSQHLSKKKKITRVKPTGINKNAGPEQF